MNKNLKKKELEKEIRKQAINRLDELRQEQGELYFKLYTGKISLNEFRKELDSIKEEVRNIIEANKNLWGFKEWAKITEKKAKANESYQKIKEAFNKIQVEFNGRRCGIKDYTYSEDYDFKIQLLNLLVFSFMKEGDFKQTLNDHINLFKNPVKRRKFNFPEGFYKYVLNQREKLELLLKENKSKDIIQLSLLFKLDNEKRIKEIIEKILNPKVKTLENIVKKIEKSTIKGYVGAYTIPVNPPEDIKALLPGVFKTMIIPAILHEVYGHGFFYLSYKPTNNYLWNFNLKWGRSIILNEAFAFLFEKLLLNDEFLGKLGLNEKEENKIKKYMEIRHLSVLLRYVAFIEFIKTLFKKSNKIDLFSSDANELWKKIAKKYIPGKIYDFYYLLDYVFVERPLYPYNYIVAEFFSDKLKEFLEDKFGKNWFEGEKAFKFLSLVRNLYKPKEHMKNFEQFLNNIYLNFSSKNKKSSM